MKANAGKGHYYRRKSDIDSRRGLEKTVDEIAMTLCPPEEWEAYEERRRTVMRQSRVARGPLGADVKMFPIWYKYRRSAERVAKLQQALPVLKYMPLRLSYVLGELFVR